MSKRKEVKTIAPADFARMLAAIDTRYPSGVRTRALLLLAWHSGMRVGELCWSRADALKREEHEWAVPPEGKSGARTISLPRGAAWDDLDAALAAWEAIRPASVFYFPTMTANGKHQQEGTERTGRMHENTLGRTLDLLTARAGVPRVHPHMLRHTWATLALRRGWTMADVARQLGHSSPSITAQYYAHSDTRRLHECQAIDARA